MKHIAYGFQSNPFKKEPQNLFISMYSIHLHIFCKKINRQRGLLEPSSKRSMVHVLACIEHCNHQEPIFPHHEASHIHHAHI